METRSPSSRHIQQSPSLPEGDEFTIQFYRGILGRNPFQMEALYLLAGAYARRGEHGRSLALRHRLARLRPHDSWVIYKLATSYSLLYDSHQALLCLARAAALGFRDVGLLLRDRTLDFIRTDSRFHAILCFLRGEP